MTLLSLFLAFFRVGALSFGGGYAAMPLIEEQAVHVHGWLSMSQFADIMAISEMTPGPIAVNAATFVGVQAAGIPGALVATFGDILPSCFIVTALAVCYYRYRGLSLLQGILKGLRPATVAMIASACVSLIKLALFGDQKGMVSITDLKWIPCLIFVVALVVIRKYKPDPLKVIFFGAVAGIILSLLF